MIITVQFYLKNEIYAIPVQKVLSVERIADFTPVDRTPSWFKGAMNLRNELIALIDLRSLLGKPDEVDQHRNRLIIVEALNRKLGLLVDEVTGIKHVEEDKIPADENLPSLSVIQDEEALLLWLDVDRLFEEEQIEKALGSVPGFKK